MQDNRECYAAAERDPARFFTMTEQPWTHLKSTSILLASSYICRPIFFFVPPQNGLIRGLWLRNQGCSHTSALVEKTDYFSFFILLCNILVYNAPHFFIGIPKRRELAFPTTSVSDAHV